MLLVDDLKLHPLYEGERPRELIPGVYLTTNLDPPQATYTNYVILGACTWNADHGWIADPVGRQGPTTVTSADPVALRQWFLDRGPGHNEKYLLIASWGRVEHFPHTPPAPRTIAPNGRLYGWSMAMWAVSPRRNTPDDYVFPDTVRFDPDTGPIESP